MIGVICGWVQALADKATRWWVAEGRRKYPHVEAALIRKLIAATEREEQTARGELEDQCETGRWAKPLFRPWWYMRPLYYKFDFEIFHFVLPLRPHPLDGKERVGVHHPLQGGERVLVTVADLTKKLFKCAYKASFQTCTRTCRPSFQNFPAPDCGTGDAEKGSDPPPQCISPEIPRWEGRRDAACVCDCMRVRRVRRGVCVPVCVLGRSSTPRT